jgi:hypothetical protein
LSDALRAAALEVDLRLVDPAWVESLDETTVQRLLAAAVRLYAAKVDGGERIEPFTAAGSALAVTATDVCVTASAMLEAVQVEVFELAMWRGWSRVGGVADGPAGG